MPTATKTDRRMREVAGKLEPGVLYTADGLMAAAGIGHMTIMQMRKAGVEGISQGNRLWYRGRDVIEWIEKQYLAKH